MFCIQIVSMLHLYMKNCSFYAQKACCLYSKTEKYSEKTEKLKVFLTICSVV